MRTGNGMESVFAHAMPNKEVFNHRFSFINLERVSGLMAKKEAKCFLGILFTICALLFSIK